MSDHLDAEITRQCIALTNTGRQPSVLYVGEHECAVLMMKPDVYSRFRSPNIKGVCPDQYRGLHVIQVKDRNHIHVTEIMR
jgi:hypothetical protein